MKNMTTLIKSFISLAFTLCSLASFSQNESRALDVKIMPSQVDEEITERMQKSFDRKVLAIFTQEKVVNAKGSTFAIYPSLSIIEFDKVEGIQSLQTAQLEMNFVVKNIFSGESFMVFSKNISGASKDRNTAIRKAIRNIRPKDARYKKFVKALLEKTTSYYKEECSSIIADAQKAIQLNNLEKAITLINVLPNDSECKTENQNLLDETYQDYQVQHCNNIITKAKHAGLKKDFKTALDWLAKVDTTSPCAADAQRELEKISKAADEQAQKKLEFLNKVYSDNKELQKARQQNMNAISNTYIEGINKQ